MGCTQRSGRCARRLPEAPRPPRRTAAQDAIWEPMTDREVDHGPFACAGARVSQMGVVQVLDVVRAPHRWSPAVAMRP